MKTASVMKMSCIIVFLLLLSPLAFAKCGCSGGATQSASDASDTNSLTTNANVTGGIDVSAGEDSKEKPENSGVAQELVLVTEDNVPMYVFNVTAIPLSIKTDPVSNMVAVEVATEAPVSIRIDPENENPVSVSEIKVRVASETGAETETNEKWLELPSAKEAECIKKCSEQCFGDSGTAASSSGAATSEGSASSESKESTGYEGSSTESASAESKESTGYSNELPVARAVTAVTEVVVPSGEAQAVASEAEEGPEEKMCFEECLKECYGGYEETAEETVAVSEEATATEAEKEMEDILSVSEATAVRVTVITLENEKVSVEIKKMEEEKKLMISAGGKVAFSSEPMIAKEGEIHIITSTAVERPVNVLPYEVEGKVEEEIGHAEIKEMELKTVEEEAKYVVKAEKEAKLLWVLPVTMSVDAEVSAETGEVVATQPWWSFLTTD